MCDATDVLFKAAVVSSGTTIGDLAITDIGANVAGVDNTGSTVTGNSQVLFQIHLLPRLRFHSVLLSWLKKPRTLLADLQKRMLSGMQVTHLTTPLAYLRSKVKWQFLAPSY